MENDPKSNEIEEKEKSNKKIIVILPLLFLIIAVILPIWKNKEDKPTATLGEKDINTDYINQTATPTPTATAVSTETAMLETTTVPTAIAIPTLIPTTTTTLVPITTVKPIPSAEASPTIIQEPTVQPSTRPTVQPEPEEIDKEFIITSNNQKWTEKLSIFNNKKYNNKPVIYPGIKSTYYFEFENKQDFDVECSIQFEETNKENVPIEYKLKENGKYIKGDLNNYVSCNELNTKNILVKSNSKNIYELEWQWKDSILNDNIFGDINKNITYEIEIEIIANEK